MPNYVSPGVYTIEKDISEYTPSVNTSIVGLVGFAGKGPTNKATLITSQNNLIDTFGPPSEGITGQALEGALEILEQTNSLYFVRAASDSAADASGTVSFGGCPYTIVSGGSEASAGFGIDRPLYLSAQVYNNAGVAQFPVARTFAIPAGTLSTDATGVSQGKALKKIIGGDLDADKMGVVLGPTSQAGLELSGAIVGAFAGSGSYMTLTAYNGAAMTDDLGVCALGTPSSLSPATTAAAAHPAYGLATSGDGGIGGAVWASSVTVYGSTILNSDTDASSLTYLAESLHPGAGYNLGTTVAGDTSGNSLTVNALGGQNFSVVVNDDGVGTETFKASLVGSGAFIEDVINTGETNATSEFIKGNIRNNNDDSTVTALTNFIDSTADLVGAETEATSKWIHPTTKIETSQVQQSSYLRFIKLVEGTYSLAGGDNGIAATETLRASDLIGDSTVDPKTGMQSLDDDSINIALACVPGIQTQSVQNNLITLAETTQNFLALVSPPYAVGTPQDAIDWTNGKSASTANSRTAAINSSYAAVHWPWVKVFSVFDSKDRWFDPSIYAIRQMAYTDNVSETWFAPAGFQRGRLTKPVDVEVKLNQGDRDSLYSGGNVVNPIVSFPQQGITIFGQRTTQRSPTSLDRINIRRLMIYIRKVILSATRRFIFEPNDEFTWEQIEGVLNPFLDDIRRRRGITEFRVVCDKTTNTPVRVDRNEMWTKVLIKPTKTAEVLIFEINLTNQSAQLGNL